MVNPLFILYFFVTASETGRFVCQFQHSSVYIFNISTNMSETYFRTNITKIQNFFQIPKSFFIFLLMMWERASLHFYSIDFRLNRPVISQHYKDTKCFSIFSNFFWDFSVVGWIRTTVLWRMRPSEVFPFSISPLQLCVVLHSTYNPYVRPKEIPLLYHEKVNFTLI